MCDTGGAIVIIHIVASTLRNWIFLGILNNPRNFISLFPIQNHTLSEVDNWPIKVHKENCNKQSQFVRKPEVLIKGNEKVYLKQRRF